MSFSLPGFDLDAFVRATLAEDLGEGGDITSSAVIPADARFRGVMDGVEGDLGKAALQRLPVLLRVVVENENLNRHGGS